MPDLAALTWLWQRDGAGPRYTAEHVNIWADSLRRNCSLDLDVACVTATPEGVDASVRIIAPPGEFEDVAIPSHPADRGLAQCFRRLALFRPDAAEVFGGARLLSMDLDCVIAEPLDGLFDRREDFVIFRGTATNRPYNGSMVLLTAGARSRVYTEFTAERAVEAGKRFVGSDQAWISHVLGWGEATWGPEHGVVWWGDAQGYAAPEWKLVFFPGEPKPWRLLGDSWIAQHYRRNDEWDEAEIEDRRRVAA